MYDVDEASDGREALALALAGSYDVLVTETRLPGIDGFSLCELVKRDSLTQSTPVVFVTGPQNADGIERARRAGADGILVKPCLPEVLLLEVRRILQRSHEL